ncbi:hypothetical protein VTI74DRAFT_6659 [Chaetomium olivicolor]
MSQASLTPEQAARFNDTRQPALWGSLAVFLFINNIIIVARLWVTWKTGSRHTPVLAEGVSIVLSGVLLNVIIANLMAATHYGLGLHFYTVNAQDPYYPSHLSRAFMHIWITMVLMSAFFTCIKITLLFFYKRLFLVSSSKLRIFWWANLVYVILWFFGGTSFYLFQCKPVQWYFLQYYARFGKPVPGGLTGECNATTVLHVALPMIFSLVSDIGLLVLPVCAIWNLRLSRWRKLGLLAVFGIGLAACLLELARILALLIDTDDKTDPSYGVANFLIFTAAEETTAVVCACLPVIGPLVYRFFKHTVNGTGNTYKVSAQLGTRRGPDGFHRFGSENNIVPDIPLNAGSNPSVSRVQKSDLVPLQTVIVAGKSGNCDTKAWNTVREGEQQELGQEIGQTRSALPGIYVRTEVEVVHSNV